MIKSKKQMFLLIEIFALIMMVGTVTYAFFNYTRTGVANTLRLGNISFQTTQTQLNLTNAFPIDSSIINNSSLDENNIGVANIIITGNTTYKNGIEYLVTIEEMNNKVNNRSIPIEIVVSADNLGVLDEDYYTNRGQDESIYKNITPTNLTDGKHLFVGYITSDDNIDNGIITIKAYLNNQRIAISDTYDEVVSDENGTLQSWVNNRKVFSSEEWNSITNISFKVKVEANEGIWVDEQFQETNEFCFITENSGNEASIISYNPDCGTNVVIPQIIDDKTVTGISNGAFAEKGITSVIFPETMEEIGSGAFVRNSLEKISIKSSRSVSISSGAFADNDLLTDIEIDAPDAILHGGMFSSGPNEKTVKVNVKNIPGGAFYGINVQNLFIGDDVEKIMSASFTNNKISDLNIKSDNVLFIYGGAFSSNLLENIEIDAPLANIQTGAFSENNLDKSVKINVKTIAAGLFQNMNVIDFELGDDVEVINDNAFYANKLSSIVINNSNLTTIKSGAFANNNISNLVLDCENLSSMDNTSFSNNPVSSIEFDTPNLSVPAGLFYSNSTPKTVKINAQKILNSAFNSSNVTFLELGDAIESIGLAAFSNNKLQSVTIPKNVKTISTCAFEMNDELTSIIFTGNVSEIGDSAFAKNSSATAVIENMVLPSSLTLLSKSAFSYCNFTNLTIPNIESLTPNLAMNMQIKVNNLSIDLETIPSYLLYDSNIHTLTLGNHVVTIGGNAFGYNNIEQLTIPSSVETIGESAFLMNKINSITFDYGNIKEIGQSAFLGNKLVNLDLPSIDIIGKNAFRENLLETVKIGVPKDYSPHDFYIYHSITSIGEGAFTKDSTNNNLQSIEIFLPCNTIQSMDNYPWLSSYSPYTAPNTTIYGVGVIGDDWRAVCDAY